MELPNKYDNLVRVYVDDEKIAHLTGGQKGTTTQSTSVHSSLGPKQIIEAIRKETRGRQTTVIDKLTDEEAYCILKSKVTDEKCQYYYGHIELNSSTNVNVLRDVLSKDTFQVDSDCKDDLLRRHNGKYIASEVFVFGNQTENTTVTVSGIFMVRPAQKSKTRKSKQHICPINIMGLDRLLFPNQRDHEKGFVLPRGDEVIPKVFVIKGAPGTGKTVFAIQTMVGFTNSEEPISCAYCHSDLSSAIVRETAASFHFFLKETPQSINLIEQLHNKRGTFSKQYNSDSSDRMEREIAGLETAISEELLNANREAYKNAVMTGKIRVDELGSDYEKYLTDANFINKKFKGIDVIFFDSLNISLLKKYHSAGQMLGTVSVRDTIHSIFAPHRKASRLVFFLVEDYGEEAKDEIRQYIADCEFLADCVIQLSEKYRQDYRTWSLKIKKKHFGSQVYGEHIYKICSPSHALSNIYREHSGIIVFPSIHSYLSGAREAFESYDTEKFVGSGITHLDAILSGDGTSPTQTGKSMPPDATIVIRGPKGSHKLPLGINILLGGLWSKETKTVGPVEQISKDVLILLLDEESNINLSKTAIACNTELLTKMKLPADIQSLDNSYWLEPESDKCNNKSTCYWKNLCETQMNSGKKVFFRKTCFAVRNGVPGKNCQKAVIAGFRPGCITPEEFLNIIKKLIRPDNENPSVFSRVLFVSTAHLGMRFPLLDSDKLFLPALIDVFKSERVLSIIIDIEGDGANKEMSYGLSSLADYLIALKPLKDNERKEFIPYTSETSPDATQLISRLFEEYSSSREGFAWSKIDVENVRGKEYSKSSHAVTVLGPNEGVWHHSLHVVNLKPMILERRLKVRKPLHGLDLFDSQSNRIPVTCVNVSPSGFKFIHKDVALLGGICDAGFKKGVIKGGPITLNTRWTKKIQEHYETGYELVAGSLGPLFR